MDARPIGAMPVQASSYRPSCLAAALTRSRRCAAWGRAGVPVYVVNEPTSLVRHSRFARWLNVPAAGMAQASAEHAWADYLLGPESDPLRGAVLLACCDSALTLLADHHVALARKFMLDDVNLQARLAMLNKIDTYGIATSAGITTPRFWVLPPGQALEPLAPRSRIRSLSSRRTRTSFASASGENS